MLRPYQSGFDKRAVTVLYLMTESCLGNIRHTVTGSNPTKANFDLK